MSNHESVPSSDVESSRLANRKLRALTSRQERNLVDYLDEHFLQLTRNFKKRSEESSTLKTLSTYIEAVRQLLVLILQIPPIDPSTSLRTAYLLHLTGDALGSIPGYRLGTTSVVVRSTLQDLVDFLDDLDQAWIAVLKGQAWDPESAEGVDITLPIEIDVEMSNSTSDSNANGNGKDSPPKIMKSTPPNQTDLTRLRSLLLSGESALEEWLTNERGQVDEERGDDLGDVSGMLARMGLLDAFDSLFVRTLDFLGGFAGDVSRNVVDPEPEGMME
ncbi:hypothetical protein BDZ97DRAFT_1761247 [Flammula alnicola]|nr:hypothetical protein BDZ97DRAFT_1761247 [Flammula alnicola]